MKLQMHLAMVKQECSKDHLNLYYVAMVVKTADQLVVVTNQVDSANLVVANQFVAVVISFQMLQYPLLILNQLNLLNSVTISTIPTFFLLLFSRKFLPYVF